MHERAVAKRGSITDPQWMSARDGGEYFRIGFDSIRLKGEVTMPGKVEQYLL